MSLLSTGTLFVLLAIPAFNPAAALHESSHVPDRPEAPRSDDSSEFFRNLQALDLPELPPEELWPLLERCQREFASGALDAGEEALDQDLEEAQSTWQRRYACSSLATELARRGTTSDRDRLWRSFDDPET